MSTKPVQKTIAGQGAPTIFEVSNQLVKSPHIAPPVNNVSIVSWWIEKYALNNISEVVMDSYKRNTIFSAPVGHPEGQ